ncbi:hypothetical protein AB0Y20_00990 [Heyndrickxia oleronia]
MKDKLENIVMFIEANRDELGNKKALDMTLNALRKIINNLYK